ncbi:Alpha/Beta hydrolase protein [Emericellopsis atlantica]|uniref:Alpha/Beta hydrolase protein n=1 Tax=Emericellopsis atlantica TaxID=2614577 RepID=A0A9P7ZS69_9HYPO|nr:Alpha/Beta hydrolase protein [Emericellopsis atlantica]KAG9256683.1 Alpha/Beta hydrolase protein [Emericellopsis atlantica]
MQKNTHSSHFELPFPSVLTVAFQSASEFLHVQPDTKLHIVRSYPALPVNSETTDASEKITLIFLHFWGGSSNTWAPVRELVAPQFPTLSLDFRGWGQSTGPDDRGAFSIAHLADDVEAVITHCKIGRCIVVGHSMGAKVASAVAGRRTVSGLLGVALVAPAPPTPLVLPETMREQQIHAYDTAQSAEFVVRNVLSAGGLSDVTVEAVVADAVGGSEWAKAGWLNYAMAEDVVSLARDISVPVAVYAGGKDVVEPLARVEQEVCGNNKGATLAVLPDSGHLMPLECPEELGRHILNFARSVT